MYADEGAAARSGLGLGVIWLLATCWGRWVDGLVFMRPASISGVAWQLGHLTACALGQVGTALLLGQDGSPATDSC